MSVLFEPSSESLALIERGRTVLPGGVCSSTRFNQAWGRPVYASRAKGSRFWDVDGREFLDMSMSHGAALLGHGPECLREVFDKVWELGLMCSLDGPYPIELTVNPIRTICGDRSEISARAVGGADDANVEFVVG